jgi:hypothetical protein
MDLFQAAFIGAYHKLNPVLLKEIVLELYGKGAGGGFMESLIPFTEKADTACHHSGCNNSLTTTESPPSRFASQYLYILSQVDQLENQRTEVK